MCYFIWCNKMKKDKEKTLSRETIKPDQSGPNGPTTFNRSSSIQWLSFAIPTLKQRRSCPPENLATLPYLSLSHQAITVPKSPPGGASSGRGWRQHALAASLPSSPRTGARGPGARASSHGRIRRRGASGPPARGAPAQAAWLPEASPAVASSLATHHCS